MVGWLVGWLVGSWGFVGSFFSGGLKNLGKFFKSHEITYVFFLGGGGGRKLQMFGNFENFP